MRDFKWPGFRFGIEMSSVFGEGMAPTGEGDARSLSSERITFAGSLWCLDLKRYISTDEEAEYVAVYLRRRGMHGVPRAGGAQAPGAAAGALGGGGGGAAAGGGAVGVGGIAVPVVQAGPAGVGGGVAGGLPAVWEDSRDRTTMGFSIRLCGAPGAPTSNSVCGRSVMGKSFGVDAEQSWGWEVRRSDEEECGGGRGRWREGVVSLSPHPHTDRRALCPPLLTSRLPPSLSPQSFVSVANLTERPWSSGDKLRFVINLDML